MRITKEQSKRIGKKLKVDFGKYNFDEFHRGMQVEQEHKKVLGGNLTNIGKTVLDHLREHKDYYTRLKKAGIR